MARRQSFGKDQRNSKMVVEKDTLRSCWNRVWEDEGMGRASWLGAKKKYCMARRRMITGKDAAKSRMRKKSAMFVRKAPKLSVGYGRSPWKYRK